MVTLKLESMPTLDVDSTQSCLIKKTRFSLPFPSVSWNEWKKEAKSSIKGSFWPLVNGLSLSLTKLFVLDRGSSRSLAGSQSKHLESFENARRRSCLPVQQQLVDWHQLLSHWQCLSSYCSDTNWPGRGREVWISLLCNPTDSTGDKNYEVCYLSLSLFTSSSLDHKDKRTNRWLWRGFRPSLSLSSGQDSFLFLLAQSRP